MGEICSHLPTVRIHMWSSRDTYTSTILHDWAVELMPALGGGQTTVAS